MRTVCSELDSPMGPGPTGGAVVKTGNAEGAVRAVCRRVHKMARSDLASSCLSVRTEKNSAPSGRIFVSFGENF